LGAVAAAGQKKLVPPLLRWRSRRTPELGWRCSPITWVPGGYACAGVLVCW